MTSCTPASGLATSMPSTSAVYMPTVTQTAPYPLDLLVGVKSETAPSSPWTPPSLEQAQAGLGGSVPEGVSEQMAVYERQAGLRMPGVTLESVWNNLAGNSSRIATFGRDRNKNIVWSEKAGGSSFNEYPIGWYYDANGALQVNLDQKFGAVPDSQTAAVVFAGEKPVPVKEIVTLAGGQEFFLQYFDIQTGEWQLNPAVLTAMAPAGYTVSQDEQGNWLANATDQQQLKFDLSTRAWVEALPPLSISLPEGTYTYDAAGVHITVAPGQVVDISTKEINDTLVMGVFNNVQILNADKTLSAWAYDKDNKVWIDSRTVIQSDSSNPENYIHLQSWDDLQELTRKEKLVLTAFPPDTYFPPLDKIILDYENNKGPNANWDAPFNFWFPFGVLDDLSKAPFKIVNFSFLPKGEGMPTDVYMITEQVYNQDDGSFSLLHFTVDWGDANYFAEGLKNTWAVKGGYLLPFYSGFNPEYVLSRNYRSRLNFYRDNGYLESDGSTPKIKALIIKWLTTDHVPAELENIPLSPFPKSFLKN